MKNLHLAVTTALCSCALSASAFGQSTPSSEADTASRHPAAQDAPKGAPDAAPPDSADIVVTAQRRSQSAQDIGISVAAFGGELLATRGISSSADLGRITPGVFVSGSAGGQSTQFSIRGVTQSDFNDAIEAPVAVYIDETYIPSQQGQTLASYDLERVEVLKGPQGTLFGRNATGGLVQFVVRKPTDVFSANVNVDYGRFNLVKLEAGLGGPIADGISFRLSGFYRRHDDILENLAPTGGLAPGAPTSASGNLSPCCHNVWNDNSLAFRGQLKFEPTSDLTIRLLAGYAQQKTDGAPVIERPTIATIDAQGRVIQTDFASPTETRVAINPDGSNVGTSLPGTFIFAPASGVRVPGSDYFGYDGRKITGDLQTSLDFTGADINAFSDYDAAVHIDYDLGGISIASISDYKLNKKQLFVDLEASPVNVGAFQTRARNRSFAQELRLSGSSAGFRWTAGGYFLDIDATSTRGLGAPRGSFLAASFGLDGPGVDLSNNLRLRTRSISLFGQVEYDFAPRWRVIIGLRGIRERQEYNFTSVAAANSDDFQVDGSPVLFQLQPSFNDKRTMDLWAGKAQVEFRPASGMLFYLGVNRGVKAGSYNALILPPVLPDDQIPYKPEELITIETGFKVSVLDRALTINGSFFYYDYSNYQAFTFQSAGGYVQNKKARNYGVDLEVTARPTSTLTATIAASLMNAKVDDVEIAPGLFRDVRPTYAPNQQVSASLEYRVPATVFGGELTLRVDGNYTSDFYNNIRNFNSNRVEGYVLVDSSVSWTDRTEKWRLTGRVSNIFDKRYFGIGFDQTELTGGTQMQLGTPRWWTLSIGYKF
jgi:iron complex outermembrane receptor protein